MSKREFHKPVIEAFRQNGFSLLRNARHGAVYEHPDGTRIHVNYKLNDRNKANKYLKRAGLEAAL